MENNWWLAPVTGWGSSASRMLLPSWPRGQSVLCVYRRVSLCLFICLCGFYHVASLVQSTCIKIILPPQHLFYPVLTLLHATRLGFISKNWSILLVLFYNGEPLEVCKQGNNIIQCLVLKDYLGTWRFSLMAEYLPGTSEALCSIPRITKKMERLFGMLWVKEGVKHRAVRQSGCNYQRHHPRMISGPPRR